MPVRYGQPPYLECSSKGDKRFSAFYAYVGGRSIEDHYQAAKVFTGGITGLHWRKAKGLKPVNAEYVSWYYDLLWRCYIDEHPELIEVLKAASGVSDIFGKEGHNCQATVLWNIRNASV